MNNPSASPSLSKEQAAFIRSMPKAEIHIHLEGAIAPATVLSLAKRHNRVDTLPSSNVDELQRWFTFRDFRHFIEIYFTISGLLCSPDDFETIVYECGADMHKQNIRYRELTVTPYTHTTLMDKGIAIDDIFVGLEAGRKRAASDFGVEMRWVFDIPRNTAFDEHGRYRPSVAERTLEYAIAGREFGVIGFGLGGNEVGAPPEPFAHAFIDAQKAGLLSVPHAGETVGPASVRGALDELNAARIGHGVRALEEPALLQQLIEAETVLEINPTSNVCLHVYRRIEEHPFPHLDRMGVFVTVNSDDPPLFNTTLCQEYDLLAREFGYSNADLARVARNAYLACGAPDTLKNALLAEFDQWIADSINPTA